jgi:hypothetical protein
MILLVKADLAGGPLHQAVAGAGLRHHDLSRQLLEVAIRQRSLGSTQETSGEASQLLIAPLVLFPMIIRRWRQRQRLGICTRQTIATATLVLVVVAAIAPESALAVAMATPMTLGDTIFFMKFSDNPTIVGIVGVLFVEDAVATMSTFIALRAVPAALLMIRLHCEDSSLLALGVLGLRLRGKHLQQVVHEEPPLLGLGASVGDLEEPDDESQLIIHGQLLPHLDVGDARGEHGDDLLIGDPGNLVPHLAEALDILMKRLALVLTHCLKIILGGGELIRGHEAGDELTAQVLP